MTEQSMEEIVAQAGSHAEEYHSRKNVEDRIAEELSGIEDITDSLKKLGGQLDELLWYQAVLAEIFDRDVEGVDSRVESLRELVCQDLVKSAEKIVDHDFTDFEEGYEDELDSISEQTEDLKEDLEDEQQDWEDRISNARQIIRIPGLLSAEEKSELEEVSDSIQQFVNEEIWEVRGVNEVDNLQEEWSSLTSTFNDHRTIHSYDNVQEEYSISDAALEILKELVEENETELQKIEPETLEDLKSFEEFVKQVKVSFRN